jgi:hypothetical protein
MCLVRASYTSAVRQSSPNILSASTESESSVNEAGESEASWSAGGKGGDLAHRIRSGWRAAWRARWSCRRSATGCSACPPGRAAASARRLGSAPLLLAGGRGGGEARCGERMVRSGDGCTAGISTFPLGERCLKNENDGGPVGVVHRKRVLPHLLWPSS